MMNAVYYHEIRKVSDEISNNAMDAEKIAEVKRTYEHILNLSNLARTEGLLAMEEYVENANEDFGKQFMQEFCEMVMDGTDSEDIMEIGLTEYMSRNLHSYESLIYLLHWTAQFSCILIVVSIEK